MTESIDLFAGGFSYGVQRVRVGFRHVAIINLSGKIILFIALMTGFYMGNLVPRYASIWACFAILCALGATKIIAATKCKQMNCAPPTISCATAIIMGIVLSLDGAAMAIGTAMINMPFVFIWVLIATKLVTDQLVFTASNYLGLRISTAHTYGKNANIVAGITIIIIATAKLLFEILC